MRRLLYLSLCVALWPCSTMAFRSARLAAKMRRSNINDSTPLTMGGAAHPCYRTCVEGDTRVCDYEFTLTEYTTMARACGKCPYTVSDCHKKGCITAGGEPREVKVVNHMLPGPSIQVCRGDTIRVALGNTFGSEAVTIHWHGMYQTESPFMDGVPFLTQCPIQPSTIFVYNFTANPAGTYVWHSHIGLQEPDGVFGGIVVREPHDHLAKYYDHDCPEHVMIIWHWFPHPTSSVVKSTFFRSILAIGHSLIVNGLTVTQQYTKDGVNFTTPQAHFNVTKGYRYRFRSISNTIIYCPVQLSIDDHRLLVIATDGMSVEPVWVDSIIINAGERYDFMLHANNTVRNYWIRYRGLGNCAQNSVFALAILHYCDADDNDPPGGTTYDDARRSGVRRAHVTCIGYSDTEPINENNGTNNEPSSFPTTFPWSAVDCSVACFSQLLNPIAWPITYVNNSLIMLSDLENTSPEAEDVCGEPDHIYYFTLNINYYAQFSSPGPYAQINDLSFDYPEIPFLTQYRQIHDGMYCTPTNTSAADCAGNYCICPTIYPINLGSLVEMVIFDNTTAANVTHPMHMHGAHFRVVAMQFGNGTFTLESIKAKNEAGEIMKAFHTAPLKDNVSVPSRGYTIVRFRATNPGYWFFHCHVGVHQEEGMAVVLKVGRDDQMIHPVRDFDTCGDYNITAVWSDRPGGLERFRNPEWNVFSSGLRRTGRSGSH